jgi:hypothetical protein
VKKMLGPVMMIIALTVTLIIFPILLSAVHTVKADANIADYTGLATFVVLVPFLVLVGIFISGGFLTYKEVKSGGYRKHRR